jgi:hypothetical protein
MAYTVKDEKKRQEKLTKVKRKDLFPRKTESAKKLLAKVGLPAELHQPKSL